MRWGSCLLMRRAGKSTIAACLIPMILSAGYKTGALLVDPTSPISSGALLGDRIRLGPEADSANLFVRSMASGGSLGGLSLAVPAALRLLEHWGAQIIVVETVGSGQLGADIAGIADVVFMVIAPGAGDHVQMLKAGQLEIADAYVVNKSDLQGADALASMLGDLALSYTPQRKVFKVNAKAGTNVGQMWQTFLDITSGRPDAIRMKRKEELAKLYLEELIRLLIADKARRHQSYETAVREGAEAVIGGKMDCLSAAYGIVQGLFSS